MNYYKEIDDDFFAWIESKGYVAQTIYREDAVRAFELWSKDHKQKVQIGVSKIIDDLVELSLYRDRKKRKKISGKINEINLLLDEAEQLALDWLGGESGKWRG